MQEFDVGLIYCILWNASTKEPLMSSLKKIQSSFHSGVKAHNSFWHNFWWFNSWHLSFYPELGTKEAAHNFGILQCCSNPTILYFYIQHILRACLFPAFPTCTFQYKIFNQSQAVKDGCNMSKDFFARLDSMISKITSSTPRQSSCHFIGG